VVVGIDGSVVANRAMEWAADEAERRQAPLVVVHAGDVSAGVALSRATAAVMAAEVCGFGAELLKDAVSAVTYRNPSVSVSTELCTGRAAHALIERSVDAGLLVIGRSGEGRLRSFLLGSIAHRVAAHAQCRTVIVGEDAYTDGYSIVVGVSTSPGGYAAMRFACEEARLRGGHVLGLRSWPDAGFAPAGLGYLVTGSQEGWQAAEQHLLDRWLAKARFEFPGLAIKARLTRLPLEAAIKERMQGAALLVLGTAEVTHATASRLGPVASWAIYHARCPVAITAHQVRVNSEQGSVAAWASVPQISTS
jgi:nucleotide-binding universal stress UspA family protein